MIRATHLFVGIGAVTAVLLVVLDTGRPMGADVLVFTTVVGLVFAFQTDPAILAYAMLKELLIVCLVEVAYMLNSVVGRPQIFGTFCANPTILALQMAGILFVVVDSVVSVIRSNVIFGILAVDERKFAAQTFVSSRTPAPSFVAAFSSVDAKLDAFQIVTIEL